MISKRERQMLKLTHWAPESDMQPVEQCGYRRWHELICNAILCAAFPFCCIIDSWDISWSKCSCKTLQVWLLGLSPVQKRSWLCGGAWLCYSLIRATYLKATVGSTKTTKTWNKIDKEVWAWAYSAHIPLLTSVGGMEGRGDQSSARSEHAPNSRAAVSQTRR